MENKELFEKVASRNDIDVVLAKKVCQSIFDIISEEMSIGNKVRISKFGTFEPKTREARRGFNPRTKEELKIPAKQYPSFKASATLKNIFNK